MMIEEIRNKFETDDNFRGISIAVIAVVAGILLVAAVSLIFAKFTTVADKTSFIINDAFYVVINRDEAVYNEETGADDFNIYMTAFNFSTPPSYEDVNETGWDENTPTTDQLSEDEINNLNYYESERINEKTANELAKEMSQMKSVSAYMDVYALQGTSELKLPVAYEDVYGDEEDPDYVGTPTIFGNAKSGQWYSFEMTVSLKDTSPMKLYFMPNSELMPNAEPVVITFEVACKMSPEMRAKADAANKEIAEKQAAESIEMPACSIKLVDGWYAETERTANVKLKNPRFAEGTISISYSSSTDAKSLVESLNARSETPMTISETTISGHLYYRSDRVDNSVLLVTDGKNGHAIQINITGLSFDDAYSLISNLTF
ncbi:MAG: hypothetical protein Q4F54_00305 [Coriobacteriia bacterium]|nr:hypothetical protein [Coriobacteriia bacterium]